MAYSTLLTAIFFSQVYSLYFYLIFGVGFLGYGSSVDVVRGLWSGAIWVYGVWAVYVCIEE